MLPGTTNALIVSKRRFHRITINSKVETLYLIHNCRATCVSRRGDGLSCASSGHLSNSVQRSTTVQKFMLLRYGHGDTHEVRAFMDLLRRQRVLPSFGSICRLRDRPRFNAPGLRHTDTNRRCGKSHAALGQRHVDISLRTTFLPVTFFSSPHLRHWFRDTRRCFRGSPLPLEVLLPFVGRAFAVSSLATTECVITLTGHRAQETQSLARKPRPRRT